MNHLLKGSLLIVFLMSSCYCFSQEKLNYTISGKLQLYEYEQGWADKVTTSYLKYLNTLNIEDKAGFWNKEEVEKYGLKYFDFTSNLYQGIPVEEFSKYFSVYVLDIVKITDYKYQLDALIHNLPKSESPSSVWCIHSLIFSFVDGEIKFENKLNYVTDKWHKTESKYLVYYNKNKNDIPSKEIIKSNESFIENLVKLFNLQSSNGDLRYDYYFADSVNELGELLNYEYYFVGITNGVTTPGISIISSESFSHLHEIVHLYLPYNDKRGIVIEEGIASFLGTREKNLEQYYERILYFKEYLDTNEIVLSEIVKSRDFDKLRGHSYGFGSLICELVFKQKGNKGLNLLVTKESLTDDDLINTLSHILNKDAEMISAELENLLQSIIKNK